LPFALRLLAPLLLVAALVACSDDPDEPTESTGAITPIPNVTEQAAGTPTQGPGAVLTPQPGLRSDLATARRLESEGDIEGAAAAYIAVAASKSPESDEATLSAARLLLKLKRYEDARLLLEPFVERAKTQPPLQAAFYLLARAYSGLEMWEESLAQFDAYIATGRPATPYAHLDRNYILLELERPAESAQTLQTGLSLGVPASMERTYLLAIAQSYERAGRFGQAIDAYKTFINESGLSGDVALALSRIVALKKLNNDPTFPVELHQLLAGYPGSPQALEVLEDAEPDGETPSVRGLIYYRHNDYTKAEPEFDAQVAAAPNAGESALAHYYLGAIYESRGDIDEALASYALVDQTDPASLLADDALWWRGRIDEQEGRLESAGALYARIVDEYPNSQFAADAAFRRGLLPYREDDYVTAAATWVEDLNIVSDPEERYRLQLWQAKALVKADQAANAAPILDTLADVNEDDYHGIRALGLKDGQHAQPGAVQEDKIDLTPDWDWTSAETWLATKTGKPATAKVWETDNRWARARELWTIGRDEWGDLEVYDLIDTYATDSVAMYTLSRALQDMGRQSMSGRAGQRLLRTLNTNPRDGLPKPLLALSYPAAFGPLVQEYADDEDVSPLLLLAFIRQESFFDPRAVSPVGALGLTQVLPDTAEALAKAMNLQNPDEEDLLHAGLNLRLGARYMADQLDRFDEEVFVALAAYNAGPNAADRWRDASGDDADLYVETVEFAETRLYIEIVAENYAIYRYLYANEPEPNLPD
jgi:soluble lytic murein transglycosylase